MQRRRSYTGIRPHMFPYPVPRIHAMVFSPADGILRRLPVNFRDYMKHYQDIYGLYDPDSYLHSAVEPLQE